MADSLHGLTVTILGGDRREQSLAQVLIDHRIHVITKGHDPLDTYDHKEMAAGVMEAVRQSDAVIAPMHGADEAGDVRSAFDSRFRIPLNEEFFAAVGPKRPFFIGTVRPSLRHLAEANGVHVVAVAHIDEVAVLNCIPTAEGAVQRAMEELPITIHGCRAVVIGFGRCGHTLAGLLHRMGAQTSAVSRDAAQRARAYAMGITAHDFVALPDVVRMADVVFNTVPARVVTRDVLRCMGSHCVVIDIASAPGGTDFAAAADLGIRATLELGLPGRVAPVTAGAILADALPRLLKQYCS